MTYSIQEHQAIQVVKVEQLLNELDNNLILKEVQNRIEKGFNKFVIDLSSLNFMNSVGLNFMISVMNRSKNSGGDLTLANANAQVVNLLEITKLTPMFKLAPSVEKAVNDFTGN